MLNRLAWMLDGIFTVKEPERGAENFSLVEKDVFTLDWFAEILVKHSGVSKIAAGW